MSTGYPNVKSTTEFLKDYVPTYKPIFPLFLTKGKKHAEEIGQAISKRYEAVGDYRMAQITPKDTLLRTIGCGERSKTFKKLFLMNQFELSGLQSQDAQSEIVKQVLDEGSKQFDEGLWLGGGTSDATVVNDGIFWTLDANRQTLVTADHSALSTTLMSALLGTILSSWDTANQIAGEKILIPYGDVKSKMFEILSGSTTLMKACEENGVKLAMVPDALIPASNHGILIINLDQVVVHYTAIPKLDDTGFERKSKVFWTNFLQGNTMVDILVYGGIMKQSIVLP
jgi:hypothetical protein